MAQRPPAVGASGHPPAAPPPKAPPASRPAAKAKPPARGPSGPSVLSGPPKAKGPSGASASGASGDPGPKAKAMPLRVLVLGASRESVVAQRIIESFRAEGLFTQAELDFLDAPLRGRSRSPPVAPRGPRGAAPRGHRGASGASRPDEASSSSWTSGDEGPSDSEEVDATGGDF